MPRPALPFTLAVALAACASNPTDEPAPIGALDVTPPPIDDVMSDAAPEPPDLPPADLFITAEGDIRDATRTLHAVGTATDTLRDAVADAPDTDDVPIRLVDVDEAAPADAVVTLVQTCHAPEAALCVVRLRWPDVTHDVARPELATSGPFAELPVILRVDSPYARVTPPTSGGTGWLRVPSDTESLTEAMRAEAQRSNTSRAIVAFKRGAPASEVARTLTLLNAAGYDDVTFAGTF